MDDIRPPQTPKEKEQKSNNFSENSSGNNFVLDDQQSIQNPDYKINTESLPNKGSSLNKKSKKAKISIIILVILVIASAAAAGYLFYNQQNMQKEIDTLTAENTQLKQEVYSLKYDNKDILEKEALFNEQKDILLEKINMLKTNCGSNCDAITIPSL